MSCRYGVKRSNGVPKRRTLTEGMTIFRLLPTGLMGKKKKKKQLENGMGVESSLGLRVIGDVSGRQCDKEKFFKNLFGRLK